MGCSPDSDWAFVLSGPERAIFPLSGLMPSAGGLMAVRSGGVVANAQLGPLADTPFRGPIHLRPDGTYVEITLPDHYDSGTRSGTEALRVVRASGEVCGEGGKAVGAGLFDQYAWCSQADGSGLREARVAVGREMRALTGPWQLLDDDTALVLRLGPGGGLATVDLDSLEVLPYPVAALNPTGADSFSVGADGVVYGSVQMTGAPAVRGAFLPSGFVPLSEIYDVEALVEEGATGGEITSLLVMEDVVAIQHGSQSLRVPRTRWDGGTTCEPTTAPGLDADGDGFVADTSCGRDCDDGDPDVHPFVSDPCGDGVDSDCDGTPDSGMTCWEDADEDGFAPAVEVAITTAACACPTGFTDREPTAGEFDCFDGDARMYPGQTEYFNRPSGAAVPFDFNCDGVAEERWTGDGACGADPDSCTTTDGWNVSPGCGGASIYFGCAEPGMCGPRCARALVGSAFVCAAPGLPTALVLTQECR